MSDTDKRNAARIAAVKTLERLGYTYEGGVEWKPPLGQKRDAFIWLRNAVIEAQTAVRHMAPSFDLAEMHIRCAKPHDLAVVVWSSPSFMQAVPYHVANRPMDGGEFELMGVKIRGVVK
jgi:hypothetical protein